MSTKFSFDDEFEGGRSAIVEQLKEILVTGGTTSYTMGSSSLPDGVSFDGISTVGTITNPEVVGDDDEDDDMTISGTDDASDIFSDIS